MIHKVILYVLFLIIALFATPAIAQQSSAQAGQSMQLRDRLLTSSPEEMGLNPEDASAKVWGVLMEIGFSEGIVTIVSLSDGTANICTNNGRGVRGGYRAQKQAQLFISESEKHLAGMKLTKSFPYPAVGRVMFYVLTQEGVYTTQGDEKELLGGEHALSPLFRAGNEVLIVLRAAGERPNPTRTRH